LIVSIALSKIDCIPEAAILAFSAHSFFDLSTTSKKRFCHVGVRFLKSMISINSDSAFSSAMRVGLS
jgi:hypothetical protein